MRPLLVLVYFALSLPSLASATGLAVSPSSLYIKTGLGEARAAYFTVSNPDNQVQAFEIYADDFQNFIRINPPVFTLGPGGVKKVLVEITEQNQHQIGNQRTTISVVSHPLTEKGTQIATGAKIFLNITDADAKTKLPPQNLAIGLVALGSLIAAAAWQKLKKN